MSFYQERIVPYLVQLSMRQDVLVPYRQRLVSLASGRVLEIGVGSGVNLPLYGDSVERVVGLDPSPKLLAMARNTMADAHVPIALVEASAESIPLESQSVDTVLTTWTLCSIPDVPRALKEVRRVLKPHGRLLFVEHGRSPDSAVARWQDRLTPIWRRLAGGCRLNRAIPQVIEDGGFRIEQIATGYMKGPKLMTYMYEGRAGPS
jgi:ubiquinone/menaquinone biosynthesis C-methylase UbiE